MEQTNLNVIVLIGEKYCSVLRVKIKLQLLVINAIWRSILVLVRYLMKSD